MTIKNLFLFIIIFYFIFIFQASFMAHFNIKGVVINIALITLFLLNILEPPETNNGIFAAGIFGFFWDIFSEKFVGFHILILIVFSFLIKTILVRYVRIKIFAPR